MKVQTVVLLHSFSLAVKGKHFITHADQVTIVFGVYKLYPGKLDLGIRRKCAKFQRNQPHDY